MSGHNYLKYFITEDIYVLPEDKEMPAIPSAQSKEPPTEPDKKVPEIDNTPTIEIPKKEVTVEEKYTPPVYSGLFLKKILVFIYENGLKFEKQDLLYKILSSISLGKDDVAILPTGHIETKKDFEWLKSLETHQVLAFGLTPQWRNRMHEKSELYVNHELHHGNIMFVDSLASLDENVEKRKQLWGALKKLRI